MIEILKENINNIKAYEAEFNFSTVNLDIKMDNRKFMGFFAKDKGKVLGFCIYEIANSITLSEKTGYIYSLQSPDFLKEGIVKSVLNSLDLNKIEKVKALNQNDNIFLKLDFKDEPISRGKCLNLKGYFDKNCSN